MKLRPSTTSRRLVIPCARPGGGTHEGRRHRGVCPCHSPQSHGQEDNASALSDADLARLTLAISQEFDLLESRLLSQLQAGLSAQQEALVNLSADLETVESRLDHLAGEQSTQAAALDNLSSTAIALGDQVQALELRQDSHRRNQTAQLQRDIDDARTDIGPLRTGLAGLAEAQHDQSEQIEALQGPAEKAERTLMLAATALGLLLVIILLNVRRPTEGPGILARITARLREHRQGRREAKATEAATIELAWI